MTTPANPWPVLWRLFRDYMTPYWRLIALALVCMVLAGASQGGLAYMLEPLIDDVFQAKTEASLLPIALGVFALFCVKAGTGFLQSALMGTVARSVIAQLQAAMFDAVIRDDLAGFQTAKTGGLVSHFIHDTNLLMTSLTRGATYLGRDTVMVLSLVTVMALQDPVLTVVVLVVLPLAAVPIGQLGRGVRQVSQKSQAEMGVFAALLSEVFQGIRHVKADGAEGREVIRAVGRIGKVARLMRATLLLKAGTPPVMEVLSGLAMVGVILYGGNAVISGDKTTGEFFSFIAALLLAYDPMRHLATLYAQFQEGGQAAARIFRTVDRRPVIIDPPSPTPLDRARGRIALEGVGFTYGELPVLDAVDLVAEPGETVALVGPSGAGKSTILNLIPRFYDPSSGRLTLDGTDLRDLRLADLRRNLALVSQDVVLFDESVRANIAYGRPDAGQAEIIDAARRAAADPFIRDLPQGYDTVIGEGGTSLSGGQRQRLSIARALLKDAPVLLLDEATSALDSEAERLVQDGLSQLIRGRTTLLIAHRLSTVMKADRIYVLDQGRVVEQGDHSGLLARDRLYARLWRMQGADRDRDQAAVDAAG